MCLEVSTSRHENLLLSFSLTPQTSTGDVSYYKPLKLQHRSMVIAHIIVFSREYDNAYVPRNTATIKYFHEAQNHGTTRGAGGSSRGGGGGGGCDGVPQLASSCPSVEDNFQ